ncbi:hypothetical protein WJX72_011143 [[Myrmecia] bisecta]|uniref:Glycosyltransferase family 92 protein n=1 Tax=[Myrmecia] bisecta TaxID=41462 RepID=A0AAW1PL88_9CHLO
MRTLRSPGSFLTARGVQALIALPLLLAVFALSLQWGGGHSQEHQQLVLAGGFPGSFPGDKQDFVQVTTRSLGQEQPHKTAEAKPDDAAYQPQNDKVSELWRPGNSWKPGGFNTNGPQLAFITTTSDSFKQIKLWVQYHQAVGVAKFYLFVDGQAARPEVSAALRGIPGVEVIPRDENLKYAQAHSRIWNETWLSAFFHKPCNHELFVLQSLNMEAGIQLAKRDKMDWVLHIDTDELMWPGGAPEYNLQRVLETYDADVDLVVFPNYESLPERDDVTDPFTEVTLFKRNYHHVVSDAYFKSYHSVARGNPNYFITYGNGKSAARVQPGLRPNGAHRWYSYVKTPREETSDQAAVLHFTYNRFQDLKSRRDRCDCAPTEEDAKRCFILPFDRMAFLAASLKSDTELMEWFRERLVWNDPKVVIDLLRNGLFVRLYTPQVLNGFQLVKLSVPADIDWDDQEQVKAGYYPAVEELLKQVTGATRVHIFDNTARHGHIKDPKDPLILPRRPVSRVHVDYTVKSGAGRLNDLLPDEADSLRRTPFAIVQVWRPLRGPVQDSALGIIDASTVAKEDLLPSTLHFPGRTGYTYQVAANPNHRWYYTKGMNADEAYVFVCYDSRKGRARFTPHTGFIDHSAPADAPPRESIEIRSYCFFEDLEPQEYAEDL